MDIESHTSDLELSNNQKTGGNQAQIQTPTVDASKKHSYSPQKPRISSSLRMRYQGEVQLIIKKWGDLEDIRKHLGLSKRKISQLLMVDPSAWTRWSKQPQSAPPHIYRALSWFLLLQEKNPEAHPYYWLATVSKPKMPKHEIEDMKRDVFLSVDQQMKMFINNQNSGYSRRLLYLQVCLGTMLSIALISAALLWFFQ